jgi:hypothetical protein
MSQFWQTLGIAETQRGQVHNHRPVVAIDDAADVPDSHFRSGEIQLAADARDGLAGWQDPVAQLKLFLPACVSHTSEHHGRLSARDHPLPGRPCAPGEWRRAAVRPFGPVAGKELLASAGATARSGSGTPKPGRAPSPS